MDDKLLQRARKKYLSTALAAGLVRLNSPLNKGYALTHGCQSQLLIDQSGQLSSPFYCKRRWCMSCASIQMATMINQYKPQLEREGLQFVTLTQRTVVADQLPKAILDMSKRWRQILDLARKKGRTMNGLRKLECKVAKGGNYHPHYHVLIEDLDTAQWLIEQWLKRSPTSSPAAQDCRTVRDLDAALIELMKYATKLTCAEDSGNEVILATTYQMDVIFQALHKKRLYQPFGDIKAISEDDFKSPTIDVVNKARGLYEWIGCDWYHIEYGQPLSGWSPEGEEIQLYKKLKK